MSTPPPIVNYELLYVMTSKNNPKYLRLKELLKNEKVINELKSRHINVMENIINDDNVFKMSLYNINMVPIQQFDDVNEEILQTIYNIIDDLLKKYNKNSKTPQSGGNQDSYKQKYYKYKKKYNDMKTVITKFYFQ